MVKRIVKKWNAALDTHFDVAKVLKSHQISLQEMFLKDYYNILKSTMTKFTHPQYHFHDNA